MELAAQGGHDAIVQLCKKWCATMVE